ncbi:MAG: MBL fold metallo-hydrolase [Promethearchaeota archaeon]|nr:MAG: MBL fold metallo-hydrolase [Candidatus Lokiarchaeota archaeon]
MTRFKSEVKTVENVIQIKIDVPFNVKFVSLYLFDINGKKVLIDSGLNMGNWDKHFFSTINEMNLSLKEIDYCIITHIHTDHIGLIKKFKQINPNMKLLMHDITHRILKWEKDEESKKEFINQAREVANLMIKFGISKEQGKRVQQFFTFWPKYIEYQKPDLLIHDGDIILDDLQIIWTPGHSFGHICVFNRKNRFLFSGDHILSRITPHIGIYVISNAIKKEYEEYHFDNILAHYLESLDKIDELNPKIIFPAHQEIIFNPHDRIQQIKKHHKQRLYEVLKTIEKKPLTPYEISQIHFGLDLDEMNSYLALSEVLSHLIYLENEGKVIKFEKNGMLYYKPI